MDVRRGLNVGTMGRAAVILLCSLMFACGGGGGGKTGGSNPPPNVDTKPMVNAGADRVVNMTSQVELDPGVRVANPISSSLNAQSLEIQGSSDNRNAIVRLVWTKIEGPDVSIQWNGLNDAKIKFLAPSTGGASSVKVTFKLTLTNAAGLSAEDTVTITVNRVNRPPVASAGDDVDALSGDTVQLDGSLSKDGDGSISRYQWTQVSGESVELTDAQSTQPSFTAPDVNETTTFEFKLTVEDNDGEKAEDSVLVIVTPSEAPWLSMHFPPAQGIFTGETLSLFGIAGAKGGASMASLTIDVGMGPIAVELGTDGSWRADSVAVPAGGEQISIAVEAIDTEGRKSLVRSNLKTSPSATGTGQDWNTLVGIDVDPSTNKLWLVSFKNGDAKLMSIDLRNGNRSETVSNFNDATQGVRPSSMASMYFDDASKQLYLSSAEALLQGISYGNGQILRVDAATGKRSLVADANRGAGEKLQLPWGMTAGAVGELYVAENMGDAIFSIDVNTGDRTLVADGGTTLYGIDAPKLLARDKSQSSQLFIGNSYTVQGEIAARRYVQVLYLDLTGSLPHTELVFDSRDSELSSIINGLQAMAVDVERDILLFSDESGNVFSASLSTGETKSFASLMPTVDTFAYDEIRGVIYAINDFPQALVAVDPLSGTTVTVSKPR